MCGLRYGSAAAVAATESWLGTIQREAYLASAALAAEKGAFPLFDREQYLAGETVDGLGRGGARRASRKHGIRNALLTSVAPTGTISLFADNVSSGIEPVFSFRYTPQRADARRHAPRGGGHRLRLPPVPPPQGRGRAAAGLFRRCAGADARRITSSCRRRCRSTSTARSRRRSTCRPISRSTRFKDVYLAGLCARLQGLHDLPAERGHRRRARGQAKPRPAAAREAAPAAGTAAAAAGAGGVAKARRYLRGGRRRLHDAAAEPARGAARPDLQGPLAGQRARALHHVERHRPGRQAAALRGLHQLEEHGALRLDGRR